MLQVSNGTPFPAALMILPNAAGVDTAFAVIKATYTIEPRPRIMDQQIPLAMAAEHHGAPGTTSIKQPSDVSLDKPGTDVVVLGHAYAPDARPTRSMDVSVSVASLHKTVRVFGDRRWEPSGASYAITTPDPFTTMPLVWERAFGGADRTPDGPTEDGRNPVGTGYRAEHGMEPVEGLPLPNLEDPADLIVAWKQRPAPAGLGPIEAHWEPRRSFAGTYDEHWQKTRAPYLPTDFDPRFLHIAPVGLSSAGHLHGGEPVDLRGLTPEGSVQFHLPALRLQIVFNIDGVAHERPGCLDTVILEPTARRFTLLWRASVSCDKQALRLSHVAIGLPASG